MPDDDSKDEGLPEYIGRAIGFDEVVATLMGEAELKRGQQSRLKSPMLSELRKAECLEKAAEIVNRVHVELRTRRR